MIAEKEFNLNSLKSGSWKYTLDQVKIKNFRYPIEGSLEINVEMKPNYGQGMCHYFNFALGFGFDNLSVDIYFLHLKNIIRSGNSFKNLFIQQLQPLNKFD